MNYKLKDICTRISSGKNKKSEEIKDAGKFPVYGGNGIRGFSDEYNFDGECVIVGRQGANCGNVRYFAGKAYMTDHAVVICTDEKTNTKYLSYLLSGLQLGRLSGQAAQPGISVGVLSKQSIDLPSVDYQNKVVRKISLYDDLIANNNKRIKILEKMAENLYKEWFVRFRFPGYETAEFVDGVPKDWKKMNLFDVASVCYGYNFSSDLFCDDKSLYPVVRIRDIVNNYTNTFTSEECDEKYIIENNSILVGMDGIFHTRLWTGGRAFLNQRVVKLNSMIDKLSNYQLYHAVYPQIKFWEQTISGTTVAHLGDKHLKKISIFMPDERTLKKAFDIFENLLEQQYILHKQNQNLIKQRNYLLPRLMSGNLQVK